MVHQGSIYTMWSGCLGWECHLTLQKWVKVQQMECGVVAHGASIADRFMHHSIINDPTNRGSSLHNSICTRRPLVDNQTQSSWQKVGFPRLFQTATCTYTSDMALRDGLNFFHVLQQCRNNCLTAWTQLCALALETWVESTQIGSQMVTYPITNARRCYGCISHMGGAPPMRTDCWRQGSPKYGLGLV